MSDKDGGPAFPIPHKIIDANDLMLKLGDNGMTLRDYFAAASLMGLCASIDHDTCDPKSRAELSYENADAMLEARKK